MANVNNGNTRFVDTAADITTKASLVYYVIVTATSANAVVVLSNQGNSEKKADLRVATSGATQTFDFSANPISFPLGIKVTTLTNAVVTLVV